MGSGGGLVILVTELERDLMLLTMLLLDDLRRAT